MNASSPRARAMRGLILPAMFSLDQLSHRQRGVRHARGEAPLVVVPSEDTNHLTIDDIGLR